jgi:hypothetical protein
VGAGVVGTIFDAEANRRIVNAGAGNATTGFFAPEGGGLSAVYTSGLTPAQLAGFWTLEITDVRVTGGSPPPAMLLREFALNFTSGLVARPDVVLPTGDFNFNATTRLRGGAVPTGTGAYPNAGAQAVMPGRGYGPAPAIAADNTLGSFSPFQGRLYVAYAGQPSDTAADDTNIYLITSDDGGASWSGPVLVNDDVPQRDGFSQGDRPQLEPAIAVDPITGTVRGVVPRRPLRRGAGAGRHVAGGQRRRRRHLQRADRRVPERPADGLRQHHAPDRHPGPDPREPVGGNPLRDATFLFGDRQGLAVLGGRVVAAWAGNQNGGDRALNRLDIRTARARIAAGPRVVRSTMGPVTAVTTAAGASTTPSPPTARGRSTASPSSSTASSTSTRGTRWPSARRTSRSSTATPPARWSAPSAPRRSRRSTRSTSAASPRSWRRPSWCASRRRPAPAPTATAWARGSST